MAEPSSVDFWDYTVKFQEKANRDLRNGKAGLVALAKIHDLLGPYWNETKQRHALRNHLQLASQLNNDWLAQFAGQLEELRRIPGSRKVLTRLGSSETYAAASGELDFALKLRLRNYHVEFVPTSQETTPDLSVRLGEKIVGVEITSLNTPSEDSLSVDAFSAVLGPTFNHGTVAGGILGHVPTLKEITKLKEAVEQASKTAVQDHRMMKVNVPGLLMCFVAPSDLRGEIPQMWRGSFVMNTRTPKPKKDRLARTIEEKAKSQLLNWEPGLLVVYDRFSSPEEMEWFFDERDIGLLVGTFPNLAGVILIHPFSSFDKMEPRLKESEGRTLVEYSLPVSGAERCVIWANPMTDHETIIRSIIECLKNFPTNLGALSVQNNC